MIARLLMALRKQGASQGKPFFGTQAMGIPLVAAVFILLRVLLLSRLSSGPTNVLSEGTVLKGFRQLHLADFLLLSCCIWVYTVDFFQDVLHWDALGFSVRSWQVIWCLFWGLMPFLGLLLVAPFITALNVTVVSSAFRWAILGGMGYVFVHRLGGKISALLGPFFIAFTFAFALFWDVSGPWELPLWRQGVLVFILNVWVMQWFEQDKDGVSHSTNIWRSFGTRGLTISMVAVTACLMVLWGGQAQRSWGLPALLLLYWTIMWFPNIVRPFRLYRLIIDGGLLLWLL
jgi:hypothetical protein